MRLNKIVLRAWSVESEGRKEGKEKRTEQEEEEEKELKGK